MCMVPQALFHAILYVVWTLHVCIVLVSNACDFPAFAFIVNMYGYMYVDSYLYLYLYM